MLKLGTQSRRKESLSDHRPDYSYRNRRTSIVAMTDPNPTPESLAAALVSHARDNEGEPERFLRMVVAEVLGLEPAVRQRFSDLLLTDLKEEIARREDPRHARAVVGLIEEIEDHWKGEPG